MDRISSGPIYREWPIEGLLSELVILMPGLAWSFNCSLNCILH